MTKEADAIRALLKDPFHDSDLTAKEREVARLAAFGYPNRLIAAHLGLTVGAVNSRIFFARRKLNASKNDMTMILIDQIERIVQ